MTKILPTPAMPMGIKFDEELSFTENARLAWDAQRDLRRSQSERSARQLTRRIFKTGEIDFEYRHFSPETPLFVVDDELVAYQTDRGGLALVELCGECGEHWQLREFRDLAGFGRAIDMRDEAMAFVCRDCQIEGHARKRRK